MSDRLEEAKEAVGPTEDFEGTSEGIWAVREIMEEFELLTQEEWTWMRENHFDDCVNDIEGYSWFTDPETNERYHVHFVQNRDTSTRRFYFVRGDTQ